MFDTGLWAQVLSTQAITKIDDSAGSVSPVVLKVAEPADGSDGKAADAASLNVSGFRTTA